VRAPCGGARLSVCILVAARREGPHAALWLAANRDEDLKRPWRPPEPLNEGPLLFGGRDLVGGGTWLALNLTARFFVGVTNARRGARAGARSRGRLVLDLAAEAGAAAAVALLTELDLSLYGAFNLLVADEAAVWIASNAPVRVVPVEGPVAAIGNDPLDAPSERIRFAAAAAGPLVERRAEPVGLLERLLADHDGEDPLCRHGEHFGTVCATIASLSAGPTIYRFAGGRPCVTPFVPVPLPPV
jgi:uncharacterized protein with NRDE domain